VAAFILPKGTFTHSFRWEPGRASFKTVRGSSKQPGGPVVTEHVFSSGIPSAGQETFQILLYVVASENSLLQKENEVVLEKFEYLP